ncbi:hypothetical protein Tco_0940142 [Tanacetum coccineum]|uniref:Uncharacterized protein n=1 Tax=Tanacetum coccineum TaxID=301880 RepID=A0ABQ5DPI4_9ASTR
MDQDSVHMVAASKVPMLKPGVKTTIAPITAEEKAQRRLKLKVRSTLLMGIPNEHQLKFNSIKDAKSHCCMLLRRVLRERYNKKDSEESLKQKRDGLEVADVYANNEGKEIIEEHWKKAYCEWAPRNQENKNRENKRRVVPVETTTSIALISCDGLGDYDWSDQAEEGPTNFALMAYSSTSSNSEVSTDSNCSSSCLENVKILKQQNEQLLKDLRTSRINVITYKTGLESVEARLLVNKKNESVYEEDIKLLKCLGYNVVPPPYTGNFMPPKPDLSFSGVEEFVNEPIVSEHTVKKHVVETSEAKASADKPKAVKKNNSAPIIKDWVSDSEEEDMPQAKIQKKIVKPSFAKIKFVNSNEQVKSPRKTTVKKGVQNRLNTHSPTGNQRNWNYMMSQRLGSNFEMINKACYVCGSFDHLQYDCNKH